MLITKEKETVQEPPIISMLKKISEVSKDLAMYESLDYYIEMRLKAEMDLEQMYKKLDTVLGKIKAFRKLFAMRI